MLKSFLKTTLRNLTRNSLLSLVNIAGLSLGLACVMLIMLFVNDEYSYDKIHKEGDHVYRLVQTWTDTAGVASYRGNTGLTHGPTFAGDIPEIESFCRLKGWNMVVKKGTEGLEARVLMTEPGFFKMFSFQTVRGNTSHFLEDNHSVVISETTARKYFGDQDPLGKTIEIEVDEAFEPFRVTGVVKSPPLNSSIQFEMIISFAREIPTDPQQYSEVMNNWWSSSLNTFFMIRKDADAAKVQQKVAQVFKARTASDFETTQKRYGMSSVNFQLQPFLAMHLADDFNVSNGLSNKSDSRYSFILSGMALLILVIACINFINIMLARSLKRSKEIGIRKVSGSTRKQLVVQFLGESTLITAFAFLPAAILVRLFLSPFSELANKQFDVTYLFLPSSLLLFSALWIVVSLLAGLYPAFIASGFKPVQTLYGKVRLSGHNLLGRSLVVLQFMIALVLITCTLVLHRQFNYMTKSDLGYKTDHILRIDFPWGKPLEMQRMKNELAQSPVIRRIGAKAGDWNKTRFNIRQKETDWTYYETIDDQYLQVMQIPLEKGRYLSYANAADTISYCMVNEEFAKVLLDAKKNPIGQVVSRIKGDGTLIPYAVAGVVKNYHQASFHEKIEPVFLSLSKGRDAFNMLVEYVPGKEKEAGLVVGKAFKKILPYSQLEFSFMNDWERDLYSQENDWKQMVTYAAVVAILISCLGLFALTTLAVQQRVKEIGIRKVLGASVLNINSLLSLSFLKLVLIAFLFSAPVSWWIMSQWLQNFAYRIELGWGIYALSILAMLSISWLTVSYHTVRASLAKPAENLRTE